jgi:hypothetical protein
LRSELLVKSAYDPDIFLVVLVNSRITAKAPYQGVNSPVGVDASKQATGEKKSWLGLGQEVI